MSEFNEEVELSGVYRNPESVLDADEKLRLAIRTGQTSDPSVAPTERAKNGQDPFILPIYPFGR